MFRSIFGSSSGNILNAFITRYTEHIQALKPTKKPDANYAQNNLRQDGQRDNANTTNKGQLIKHLDVSTHMIGEDITNR
jgi:hypothetical protein